MGRERGQSLRGVVEGRLCHSVFSTDFTTVMCPLSIYQCSVHCKNKCLGSEHVTQHFSVDCKHQNMFFAVTHFKHVNMFIQYKVLGFKH
jgi:hypothetical protein